MGNYLNIMRTFAATLFAVAVSAVHTETEFMTHLAEYGRQMGTVAEFNYRKGLFDLKEAAIKEHNSVPRNYTLGHNKFSDWSEAEMKKMLGYVAPAFPATPKVIENLTYPATKNWVTDVCVNAVKDQGQCGSCWAFSSVCAMEGAHCVATGGASGGTLLSFSEQ